MDAYDIIRYAHVIAGTAALASYWVAALLAKGSPRHIATGRSYMIAMTVIVLTALPLAANAFALGRPVTGSFLAYLVVITATACWLAWRAIRDRRDFGAYTGRIYRGLAWLNMAAGLVVLALGIHFQVLLLGVFAIIGLASGPLMLRLAQRGPDGSRWWLREHYAAIIGCGVATHIAFLNLGLQRLIPGDYSALAQNAAFIGPLVIAVLARRLLDTRFGGGQRPLAQRAHPAPEATRGETLHAP